MSLGNPLLCNQVWGLRRKDPSGLEEALLAFIDARKTLKSRKLRKSTTLITTSSLEISDHARSQMNAMSQTLAGSTRNIQCTLENSQQTPVNLTGPKPFIIRRHNTQCSTTVVLSKPPIRRLLPDIPLP